MVVLLDDPPLNALVVKHWGRLDKGSRGEKLAEVRRLTNDLNAGLATRKGGASLQETLCLLSSDFWRRD